MELQEAVKILTNGISYSTIIGEIKSVIEISDPVEFDEAIDMAIEALEKQAPKKFEWIDSFHFRCPTCNAIYSLGDAFMFCKHCGQLKDFKWKQQEADND